MHLLTQHPDAEVWLAGHLNEEFGGRPVRFEELPRLTCLERVIKGSPCAGGDNHRSARLAQLLPCQPDVTKVQLPDLYHRNLDKAGCRVNLENGAVLGDRHAVPQSGRGNRSLTILGKWVGSSR